MQFVSQRFPFTVLTILMRKVSTHFLLAKTRDCDQTNGVHHKKDMCIGQLVKADER
jgi:hypothetical protein